MKKCKEDNIWDRKVLGSRRRGNESKREVNAEGDGSCDRNSHNFSISGGTKVVPVKAAVEVAEVLDLNENLRGQYGTLPEAFVAAQNGDTIRLLSDISDTSLTIGYNPVESGKHIILDLNGRNLTMNELNVTYSLMVKNGTMNCRLTNGNTGSGYNAPLTISKVNFSTSFLQWMPDDGVVLESGTTVTVSDSTSAQCFLRS